MVFKRIQSILGDAANKAIDYAQDLTRPEIKGVNALAASFALLVMADKIAEDDEKEAVSEFLIDMDVVVEKGLVREVAELFLRHIDTLERAQTKNNMEFNICVGEILKDISLIKDDSEYCKMVADTVKLVTSGQGVDHNESKIRDRILKALDKL